MAVSDRIGLSCALVTPFAASGAIDVPLLVRHARRTLDAGCDSITLFGTTGEGPSIGTDEREAAYAAVAKAGIDMRRQIIGGILATPVGDAVAQARMIYRHGCRAVLLAPPFYFPDPTEDGVFAWYAAVFQALGKDARDVILYHIPQFTGVPLTIPLVQRLARAFPGIVIGVKDSRGVWAESEARIKAHRDLQILIGNEADLPAAVRLGGAGTICGFANYIAGSLRPVALEGRDSPAIGAMGGVIEGVHFLGAFKALLAHIHGEPGWAHLRGPLAPLSKADQAKVVARWTKSFGAKAA